MAQGEQIHVSSYPPIWPTRPVKEKGGYNLRRAIEIRAGAHAFEAKAFNIVATGCVDISMRNALEHLSGDALETFEATPRGVSLILDPTGEVISETLGTDEGIIYADIDVSRCVEPKQFHDVVGYYNRFDIFDVSIDRSAREPAYFTEHTQAEVERRGNGSATGTRHFKEPPRYVAERVGDADLGAMER